MSDQEIMCSDCGESFLFTEAESMFYAEKGLASPPKRCKPCRQIRKENAGASRTTRGGSNGGPGHTHSRGTSHGNARYSNDVNEYRSPMTGGYDWRSTGGSNGFNGGPHNNGRQHNQHNQGRQPRPPQARQPGNGNFGNHFGNNGNGQHRSDYRSPAFGDSRGPAWQGPQHRLRCDSRIDGAHSTNGNGVGGHSAPRGPRPERAEKPRYDIQCAECGIEAQVPFKPLEGRQVFCQECYRARRTDNKPALDASDVRDADAGIVE